MIDRRAWRAIKHRLGRTPAGKVKARHRAAVHQLRAFLSLHFADQLSQAAIIPINTMQWSSVVMSHDGAHAAFIDVEQANALELLLLRGFWGERPIISHIEFLIRAAEVLYDDGDIPLATAMSERANARLRAYCESQRSENVILRPKYFDARLRNILDAQILLSFIVGHEYAHVLQQAQVTDDIELFAWIAEQYQVMRFDSSNEGPVRERFLQPEIVQKFDDEGRPNGVAIQGTKMARRLPVMIARLISEVQADALGLITASHVALNAGINANTLFQILVATLEYAEMLMLLRRLVARLPRGTKRSAIAHEGTNLFARQLMLTRFVRGIRDGEVPIPGPVRAFWLDLDTAALEQFEINDRKGRIEQFGLRSAVVARGGIEIGLSGTLAPHVTAEEQTKRLGIAAGGLVVAEAHRGFGEAYYKAEAHFDWGPEHEQDPVLIGFAHAVHDITELAATEYRPRQLYSRSSIRRDGSDASFVELLRSGRSQIVRMELNPSWASGFEYMLRAQN